MRARGWEPYLLVTSVPYKECDTVLENMGNDFNLAQWLKKRGNAQECRTTAFLPKARGKTALNSETSGRFISEQKEID